MAIQPTGGPTTTTTSLTAAAPQGTMDRDAFLKLLVAQLSHQDPLQPMEGTEFVTQLAQFTAVEQQLAQTAKLDVISLQLGGLASNEAAALVGKTVTVRGKGLAFDGVLSTSSSVTLGKPAESVKVEIKDAEGNVVRTMDMGSKGAGALGITWDGKNDAGVTQPPGQYTTNVVAKGADGKDVSVTQDVTGTVVKVTFDKGYPELVLDNGVHCPISDLVSVSTGGTTLASTTSTSPNGISSSNLANIQALLPPSSQTNP